MRPKREEQNYQPYTLKIPITTETLAASEAAENPALCKKDPVMMVNNRIKLKVITKSFFVFNNVKALVQLNT